MVLKIIERCLIDDGTLKKYGVRVVLYETPFNEIYEAMDDYLNNFNSDKIISSGDEFEEECLDSIPQNFEFVEFFDTKGVC